MSNTAATGALPGASDLTGLAAFGKVAFALLVIVAIILLCAWLLRRLGPGQGAAGQHLKVIAGKAVGPKERVVIVEVNDTWLVLGVSAGGISKLHELPAGSTPPAVVAGGTFARRFAAALRHQARGGNRP